MKTNHQRGFVDPGSAPREPYRRMSSRVSGKWGVTSDACYGGHRRIAGANRALKRFIHTMDRRALKKIDDE